VAMISIIVTTCSQKKKKSGAFKATKYPLTIGTTIDPTPSGLKEKKRI